MKPWYKSKTIIVNLLALILIGLEEKFALLQPYLHGDVFAYVAVVLAIANKVLRFVTTTALMSGADKEPK